MQVKAINSHNELQKIVKDNEKVFVLLYKNTSETSRCALKNLTEAAISEENAQILVADVSEVRDIHPNYSVTTVPSLMVFENAGLKNVVKGCHDVKYFTNLLKSAFFTAENNRNEGGGHRVTVYSTPTCSWCNTLKSYFREKGISFTDIDVSGDHKAAEEMVKRSGQQGVPQTDINGEMIIGFDKARINTLLGIK